MSSNQLCNSSDINRGLVVAPRFPSRFGDLHILDGKPFGSSLNLARFWLIFSDGLANRIYRDGPHP